MMKWSDTPPLTVVALGAVLAVTVTSALGFSRNASHADVAGLELAEITRQTDRSERSHVRAEAARARQVAAVARQLAAQERAEAAKVREEAARVRADDPPEESI